MKESQFFFDLEKKEKETNTKAVPKEIVQQFEKRLFHKTKKDIEEHERWKKNSLEQSFSKIIG